MPTDWFSKSVDMGLKLSKRIYYGKDGPPMSAPKPALMTKSLSSCSSSSSFHFPLKHYPTAPMVYAVITDPNVVDNPDIRSYQPHVHGRCNPPALIPLHMHEISMNVDCYLDTAFVTVTGAWHMHCVTASEYCDCRIAFPMGEQGSVLDIDVETVKRSYFTKLITRGRDEKDSDRVTKAKDGFLMRRNSYTLKVPQVEGGSIIHVKVRWSQKMLYQGDEFFLSVPFTFPYYVLPLEKTTPKREKILLNVNSATGILIARQFGSHPLKEVRRQSGESTFSYEEEVLKWSTRDFCFSYSVCSNETMGGMLLQSPSLHDYDHRDMFCFYLFPGTNKVETPFRKEVVFLLDISGSMRNAPLEKSKYEIAASLLKLDEGDSFNIIAFNKNVQSFSSSLELATEGAITNATEWMGTNLVAEGGTNMMCPLKQAIDMVGKTSESIPLIFLITDGTVEDEREICNMIKSCHVDGATSSPRIFAFGIGSYCNHYFLQTLAHIGRGYYDAAYDLDSIGDRMQRLLDNALSPMLANVTIDALQKLESYELYPSCIPDLLSGNSLIIAGRYQGKFPELVKVKALLADLSTYEMDIQVRKTTDLHLDMICARREVNILTTHAWLDQNKHLEEKVARLSLQKGVPSEYTHVILVPTDKRKPNIKSLLEDETKFMNKKMICLRNICYGFGNMKATAANLPPGIEEEKLNNAVTMVTKKASTFFGVLASCGCWRCLIQTWSQVRNEQCALAIAQLCTALACLECLDCCCELCDSCFDLCQ